MPNWNNIPKKAIIISLTIIICVSIFSGFALSRSIQHMSLRMHGKDLQEDGLVLLKPSDPSFDIKFTKSMEEESNDVADRLRPFSVFLENQSGQTVVAYMIEWCFSKNDGTNDCYRKAFAAPRALIEGEYTPVEGSRDGAIKPNSALLISLISRDGTGQFRTTISREEADKFRQGFKLDRQQLLLRHSEELAKYTEVTVSIDGAFFHDGTFIGDDKTGFFEQIKAQIDAKRDLIDELASDSANSQTPMDRAFGSVETIAKQDVGNLDHKSTPTDYYRYYKKFYAEELLSAQQVVGTERALAMALRHANKEWPKLRKKPRYKPQIDAQK